MRIVQQAHHGHDAQVGHRVARFQPVNVQQRFDQPLQPLTALHGHIHHFHQHVGTVIGQIFDNQFQTGDDVAERGLQIVEEHGRQIFAHLLQGDLFGDVVVNPLQKLGVIAHEQPLGVHLHRQAAATFGDNFAGENLDLAGLDGLVGAFAEQACFDGVQVVDVAANQFTAVVLEQFASTAVGLNDIAHFIGQDNRVNTILEETNIAGFGRLRLVKLLGIGHRTAGQVGQIDQHIQLLFRKIIFGGWVNGLNRAHRLALHGNGGANHRLGAMACALVTHLVKTLIGGHIVDQGGGVLLQHPARYPLGGGHSHTDNLVTAHPFGHGEDHFLAVFIQQRNRNSLGA